MITCPRHGALLYGQRCTDCDCHLAGLANGGPVPRGMPPPSMDAYRREIERRRSYKTEVDERDFNFNFTVSREQMETMARRQSEAVDRAIYDSIRVTDPPWGFEPPRRSRSAGSAGASYIAEVITDPNDRRGLDAQPARVRA